MVSQHRILKTKDGSDTLYVPELDETYHSSHGALQEAMHVYITEGLRYAMEVFDQSVIHVFELGFGTGLNAQLTAQFAYENKQKVAYTSIEKYPLSIADTLKLNYEEYFEKDPEKEHFNSILTAEWNAVQPIHPYFEIEKVEGDFFDYQEHSNKFDLIYFDAFGHRAQSELWEKVPFENCNRLLSDGGVLVTYASKGSARRNLIEAGFAVEKIPGPPGKREMMRAIKNG